MSFRRYISASVNSPSNINTFTSPSERYYYVSECVVVSEPACEPTHKSVPIQRHVVKIPSTIHAQHGYAYVYSQRLFSALSRNAAGDNRVLSRIILSSYHCTVYNVRYTVKYCVSRQYITFNVYEGRVHSFVRSLQLHTLVSGNLVDRWHEFGVYFHHGASARTKRRLAAIK